MYVVLNRLRQYKEGVKKYFSYLCCLKKNTSVSVSNYQRLHHILVASDMHGLILYFFLFHHNLVYLFVFRFLKIGRWWLLGNCGDKRRQR